MQWIFLKGMFMKYRLLMTIGAAILTNNVSAGTMLNRDWTWVSSLSVGPFWENAGQTQTFYLAPNIIKTYTASDAIHAFVEANVFTGIQKNYLNRYKAS